MSDYRYLETSGLRATEVAGTLRALESYAPAGTGTDVLFEDFANLTDAPWTTVGGTPTIVAARTGNGARVGGAGAQIAYALGANEAAVVVIGFAVLPQISSAGQRQLVALYSDTNATEHTRIVLNGTSGATAGQIAAGRGATSLGNSATGVLVLDTWAYLEVRAVLGDGTSGSVDVRVNGVNVLSIPGVDTKNAGTKTVYDTVRLGASSAGLFNVYDDLYISTGAGAPFKGSITIP